MGVFLKPAALGPQRGARATRTAQQATWLGVLALLGVLSVALESRGAYVRIGVENTEPALQSLSLVAANYGLPQRNLGTVSVIGPTRMDYARAIRSVREAAHELSRFVEELY